MRTQRDRAEERAPAHAAERDLDRTEEVRGEYAQTGRDYMGREYPDRAYSDRGYPAPEAAAGGRADAAAGVAASAPAALVLLGGIWLVVSRLVFNFPADAIGPRGFLNGIVIGAAIALVAVVRLATPVSSPMLGAVGMVLGGWMVASPWVYGYHHFGAGAGPVWSDVVTGAVVALVSLASWTAGMPRNARSAEPRT
ncbi:MAG: hypothetical protein V7603_4370 [Micromonosporaceae bacterium]